MTKEEKTGVVVGAVALLFVFAIVGYFVMRKVERVEEAVAGLRNRMASFQPSEMPVGEAMSVVLTDKGDLHIQLRAEGKNDDPLRIDKGIMDTLTERVWRSVERQKPRERQDADSSANTPADVPQAPSGSRLVPQTPLQRPLVPIVQPDRTQPRCQKSVPR